MHASEIWDGRGFGPTLARIGLAPVSLLYAGGWQAYLAMYKLGLKRPAEPHRPVICVGNLQVGGSGKTPIVHFLQGELAALGRPVVISASGYGSPAAEAAQLAPEGPLDPAEWGDEPALLRWLMPDVPLVVGRRRVLAAELVHRHHPGAVMLMDDGFQHLPLRKHVSIVLDPEHPTNRMCLPAGPYREPRSNRRRADLVLPGGSFRIEGGITRFTRGDGSAVEAPEEATAMCALGQPRRFLSSLSERGIEVRHQELRPDHDPLTAGNLFERIPPGLPVIVTAKDWVKLRTRADVDQHEIFVAHYEARVEPRDEFRAWLKSKLDGY